MNRALGNRGSDPVHPSVAAYKLLAKKLDAETAALLDELAAGPAIPATGSRKRKADRRASGSPGLSQLLAFLSLIQFFFPGPEYLSVENSTSSPEEYNHHTSVLVFMLSNNVIYVHIC